MIELPSWVGICTGLVGAFISGYALGRYRRSRRRRWHY